jgi:hypothetical protein
MAWNVYLALQGGRAQQWHSVKHIELSHPLLLDHLLIGLLDCLGVCRPGLIFWRTREILLSILDKQPTISLFMGANNFSRLRPMTGICQDSCRQNFLKNTSH